MKIDVTQQHIDNGIPRDCQECAIALAMKDAGLDGAKAAYERLAIGDGRAITPSEVREFMQLFDNGFRWALKPFSFELKEANEP